MDVLKIYFYTEESDFVVEAQAEDFEESFTLEGKKEDILEKFHSIFTIIEEVKESKDSELQKTVKELSKLLIQPIEEKVHESKKIRMMIDYELVRCAFDLLEAKGTPIYLRSEVSYMMDDGEVEDEPELELESILSISDVTADPDRACKDASEMFSENEYFDVKEAKISSVKEAEVDVLLISAHGDLDEKNSGEIDINGKALTSDELEEIDTTLVYFDSCQQGSNIDFIEAFHEEGTASYYMAPITSNDAGDSSTYTMKWFFEELKKTGNPVRSLFHTKKKLVELYKKKGLGNIKIINKSFIFRIYEFPSGEE